MSFLDSVLSSLGSTKPSQTPLSRPPAPPASSSTSRKEVSTISNSSSQPPTNGTTGGNLSGGTKRKAEDQLPRPSRPNLQPATKSPAARPSIPPASASATPSLARSSSAPTNKAKPASANPASKNGTLGQSKPVPAKTVPSKAVPAKPAAPAKPPPKGSYAALMEAAKAAQGKAPTQVGVIRNQQAAPKERLSKVERKRRLMEAQEKEKAERKAKRFALSSTVKGKPVTKKADSDAPTYKGTAKPSRTPEPVAYRGTANLPTNRSSNDRRQHGKRRQDEYLGTDEEDEGDYGFDDYDDYYSDSSADMEAGFDDVNQEEDTALKSARREDEEEWRLEMSAKKAKLERQQKLSALASRSKR